MQGVVVPGEHENKRQRTVSGLLTIHGQSTQGCRVAHLLGISAEAPQPVFVTVEHQSIFGAKTGIELDPTKVQQGRQRELDNVERFGVRTLITLSEDQQRGLELVQATWLDDIKIVDGDDTAVRSRFVATEISSSTREDVSQSTPLTKCSRLTL